MRVKLTKIGMFIRFKKNGVSLPFDSLSKSEQYIFALIVLLTISEPTNSVILLDDPETYLSHPKDQRVLMNLLYKVGKGNQVFIATNSPHILTDIPYQNIVRLKQTSNQVEVVEICAPPPLDINTFLRTMMDTPYLPEYIENLQTMYFEVLNSDKYKPYSKETIKKELLRLETSNSSFWLGIQFDEALKE